MENKCFGCGCSDTRSCEKSCEWLMLEREIGLGICSNCRKYINAFNEHKKELAKFANEI